MSDPAEILRGIADEYERSAAAKAHLIRMAEDNARRPNLPAAQVAEQCEAAQKARADQAFYRARSEAARLGAQALEARHG